MKAATLFATCLMLLSTPVFADEPAYGRHFNGAFVEASARGGLTDVSGSDIDGWLLDVGLRQAFPMHLLDTRLAFRREIFTPNVGDVEMYGGEISGAFHPIYLALLFSDWWGYVLASWYVELSAGVHFSSLSQPNGEEQSDVGFSYGFGTGLDIPVTDPDQGWSLWINGLYRYRRQDFDTETGEIDLHGHSGFLGIAFRRNGLLF